MGDWVPLTDNEIREAELSAGRILFIARPYKWIGDGVEDIGELEEVAGLKRIIYQYGHYCVEDSAFEPKGGWFTTDFGSPTASELNRYKPKWWRKK
jgi:hypothetical protein